MYVAFGIAKREKLATCLCIAAMEWAYPEDLLPANYYIKVIIDRSVSEKLNTACDYEYNLTNWVDFVDCFSIKGLLKGGVYDTEWASIANVFMNHPVSESFDGSTTEIDVITS